VQDTLNRTVAELRAKGAPLAMAFLSVADPGLPSNCLTPDGQLTRAFKYGRNTGSNAVTTKPVPFTRERFGDDIFRNVGRLLPHAALFLDGRTGPQSRE